MDRSQRTRRRLKIRNQKRKIANRKQKTKKVMIAMIVMMIAAHIRARVTVRVNPKIRKNQIKIKSIIMLHN